MLHSGGHFDQIQNGRQMAVRKSQFSNHLADNNKISECDHFRVPAGVGVFSVLL